MSRTAAFVRHRIDRTKQLTINKKMNMNTQTKTPHYMLLFRGNDWYKGLSPEEMQRVAGQWMAWFERLTAQGKAIAGNPLEKEGKLVSGKNGRVVSDGPFAESKEAIGGYFLLQVNTFDEAVAIAQECPGLVHGAKVEVRPVAENCRMSEEARAEAQLAEVSA
jgi:hypothetical protein